MSDWRELALAGGLMLASSLFLWWRRRRHGAALDHVARAFSGRYTPATQQATGTIDGRAFTVSVKSRSRMGQDRHVRSMQLELELLRAAGRYLGAGRKAAERVEVHDYSATAATVATIEIDGERLETEELTPALQTRLHSDQALRGALRRLVAQGGRIQGSTLYLEPRTSNGMVSNGRQLEALLRELVACAEIIDAA
jgi:hypothetical protein